MKRLSIIPLILSIFLFTGICNAANTVTILDNVVTISDIDSDWAYTTIVKQAGRRMHISSIQFNGAAADDKCVIKNGSDTGPVIFEVTVQDAYDARYKLFSGVGLKPYLDFSAGTYTAGSSIIIIMGNK